MKELNEEKDERIVIVIDETDESPVEQHDTETPVISIESDEEEDTSQPSSSHRHSKWPVAVISVLLTAAICMMAAFGYRYYRRYINIGVPVSVTSKENIGKLELPSVDEMPGVVKSSDSILGVAINMYQLIGLKAEITFTEPAVDDTDVYLYSRCCDQTSYDPETNRYLGSLVQNGKELQSDNSRLGYCAMANDNIVIGIARDEKVKDYCIEQKGSFFRQFILVSDGVLPGRFYLHGKVERRALARMGKKLFYVESKGKETMWDFADALREYGFIDAIYITGGTDYCFYRTADGTAHDIGDKHKHPDGHKGKGIVPWVVFKKR
jgi:hypothetical protein